MVVVVVMVTVNVEMLAAAQVIMKQKYSTARLWCTETNRDGLVGGGGRGGGRVVVVVVVVVVMVTVNIEMLAAAQVIVR